MHVSSERSKDSCIAQGTFEPKSRDRMPVSSETKKKRLNGTKTNERTWQDTIYFPRRNTNSAVCRRWSKHVKAFARGEGLGAYKRQGCQVKVRMLSLGVSTPEFCVASEVCWIFSVWFHGGGRWWLVFHAIYYMRFWCCTFLFSQKWHLYESIADSLLTKSSMVTRKISKNLFDVCRSQSFQNTQKYVDQISL